VTVSVSPSGVRVVKQALNRLGYSAGPVTGVWNEAVGQALLHFQQAHGLEPTGNLNISSIAALGLWTRLVGDPLGNQRKALETVEDLTGAPSQGAAQGGNPLISSIPSQRVTNEAPGGSTTGAGGENTQPAPQRQAGPRAKTRTHRKP
jgi:peptidoglycan hydrolase-like protein with peptidoglycan-binding domain